MFSDIGNLQHIVEIPNEMRGNSFFQVIGLFLEILAVISRENQFKNLWSTTLDSQVTAEHSVAWLLVKKIKELYRTWNLNYCKGQYLYNVGLKDEPYFRYFDYDDYLTPHSGLIQIKKYAKREGLADMQTLFAEVQDLTKKVREELYRLLVVEFRYFE